MLTQFVAPMTDRDMLREWCKSSRTEKVAGPIDWLEARRGFRARDFDLIDNVGDEWFGYKLKAGSRRSRKTVRLLTETVFHHTLFKRSTA